MALIERGITCLTVPLPARTPIIPEHEHGLGSSGLRRIRQHPARTPVGARTPGSTTRSSSMTLSFPPPRDQFAHDPGHASLALHFSEDLNRFPSESLHSFSFAQQSEELLHNRQNVLRRSIDFMGAKMGWAASNQGLANAQARMSGDQEVQSMMELLARANLIEAQGLGLQGPLTGPADVSGENIFEKSFGMQTESPTSSLDGHPELQKLEPWDGASGALNDPQPIRMSAVSNVILEEDERSISSSAPKASPPNMEQHKVSKFNPPRASLKRTLTDVGPLELQSRLADALAQPYNVNEPPGTHPQSVHPPSRTAAAVSTANLQALGSFAGSHGATAATAPHGHGTRFRAAAQAIFTTESASPWTITAANDLACLVFGVTRAEVRKLGILEVVKEERRDWLRGKLMAELEDPGQDSASSRGASPPGNGGNGGNGSGQESPASGLLSSLGSGVTAKLLSKPPSRYSNKRRSNNGKDSSTPELVPKPQEENPPLHGRHSKENSRGVLLCGDVVPIVKRNGAVGSASLWVKEKRGSLIWVLEEIAEDAAFVAVDETGCVVRAWGDVLKIWGVERIRRGQDLLRLVKGVPRLKGTNTGALDLEQIERWPYFTAKMTTGIHIPITMEPVSAESAVQIFTSPADLPDATATSRPQTPLTPQLGPYDTLFRISSFPHIAGIVVLSSEDLTVSSANSVFSSALFGQPSPTGLPIDELIPGFSRLLEVIEEEEPVELTDGIVVPEHSFRRARALRSLRDHLGPSAASLAEDSWNRPHGLKAKHRVGTDIMVDCQMRVVSSSPKESRSPHPSHSSHVSDVVVDESDPNIQPPDTNSQLVYALWITYSRQLHAASHGEGPLTPLVSRPGTPPHQPSPGQKGVVVLKHEDSGSERASSDFPREESPRLPHERVPDSLNHDISPAKSLLTQQLRSTASPPVTSDVHATAEVTNARDHPSLDATARNHIVPPTDPTPSKPKKSIEEFAVLEDMGQGAYGQVKLCRFKRTNSKVVVKYVTKRRILVDTWTRDRRLGTVPLEIHVLDYLRRDGLRHANIVEMSDFFEDDVNYYICMVPHGLPGMDLFDYIELRVNMEEAECRKIFVQVASAVHHLHTKAKVVHRDIKDENVILDGEGNIKLIDFGSAAYLKNGPFDVFVGTIDYAAPEVLAGRSYRGKEQDVWALGILLYTIIYKENPFYSIDEIMDHDLRVPYVMSDESIDLVRRMLDRDVEQRVTIGQVMESGWCREAEGGEEGKWT
ncbi:Pkinase-domain-containing protein [Eremomyces bilateralis CBS 781.70]|uniref:non-specific serine/threonine protein kinase n=1 Tax=Eremomyces bilateralis CBS 781.70 TaxID=1392243 RepID=A0A6G1GE11_9PEZI|nr:Pkinase-domain-containing protein [Eremomyces bilateralis CBS 781.70]KAF1816099.1 Pkinase-domain-containing protein [Eremomyces bilateralis CBS 781.70]